MGGFAGSLLAGLLASVFQSVESGFLIASACLGIVTIASIWGAIRHTTKGSLLRSSTVSFAVMSAIGALLFFAVRAT